MFKNIGFCYLKNSKLPGERIYMKFDQILHKEELSREEIIFLLSLNDEEEIKKLFHRADEIRAQFCGDEIHLRGIIDFSNNCIQNCIYCGLREDNFNLSRYRMSPEEIIETAKQITNHGIYSIMLQSGEDPFYDTDLIAYIIYSIKQKSNATITLSLGQRGFDEYRTWRIAGADRYMLKHETANPKLYSSYHIKQKLSDRISHLKFLKTIGYKIGSGNLIGLPMQTIEDIADDIILCKELDVDIASFSPFIPSFDTPYRNKKPANVVLALKTMAVARLVLKKTHLPSTTALGVLEDNARIKGLTVGGNVIMPNFTPSPYREKYIVYSNMNTAIINTSDYKTYLEDQIASIGRSISSSRGITKKPFKDDNQKVFISN